MAQDTARAHTLRAAEGQSATNHTRRVRRTGATQPTRQASGRSGTPRPLVGDPPRCTGDYGICHTKTWQQPVTVVLAHIPGEGGLPSSESPLLEAQG